MLQPLRDNVIVQRKEKDLTTASGIVLKSSDEADRAEVTAIGPDVTDVKVGDVVLVNWNNSAKVDKETYRVNVENIIAVFDSE
jgi:co-chaperonin GroES (HSP10)